VRACHQRYLPDPGGVMARAGYRNHHVHYQPVILRAVLGRPRG